MADDSPDGEALPFEVRLHREWETARQVARKHAVRSVMRGQTPILVAVVWRVDLVTLDAWVVADRHLYEAEIQVELQARADAEAKAEEQAAGVAQRIDETRFPWLSG